MAEDNLVNQMVVSAMLQALGSVPTLVADGAEALEAHGRQPWDLILMDIQMPNVDGLTATRRIRAREAQPGARRTPIVALSANVMPADVANGYLAGLDAFLFKPVRLTELESAVALQLRDRLPAHQAAERPGSQARTA